MIKNIDIYLLKTAIEHKRISLSQRGYRKEDTNEDISLITENQKSNNNINSSTNINNHNINKNNNNQNSNNNKNIIININNNENNNKNIIININNNENNNIPISRNRKRNLIVLERLLSEKRF